MSTPTRSAPATSRDEELAYTSYLRVISIAAVVFIHVAGLSYAAGADERTGAGWWLATVLTFATKWAVPVFVMVSGALLLRPPAQPSFGDFYRRRVSRIGIALVFWHVVYILLVVVELSSTPTIRGTLAKLLRGESYTALYFFWLILGLYLVTPLLWAVVRALTARQLTVAAVLLTVLPVVDLVLQRVIGVLSNTSPTIASPTLVTQFLPYVGFFLLGYALRDVIVRGPALVALTAGTLLVCAELVVQVARGTALPDDARVLVNTLLPVSYQGPVLALSAVGVFLSVRGLAAPGSLLASPRWRRAARYLGDRTFGVFCCHLLILWGLDQFTGTNPLTVKGIVLVNGFVLVAAFVVSDVLGRIPVLRRVVG